MIQFLSFRNNQDIKKLNMSKSVISGQIQSGVHTKLGVLEVSRCQPSKLEPGLPHPGAASDPLC